MFRLALSSHIYFLLSETPMWHFGLLSLRNMCCGTVSSKYGTWYSERVILQVMCMGSLAGVTYLRYTVLMSSNNSETAVHCCDPALSVLVMLVSRNVFHVVSALQSFTSWLGVWSHVVRWCLVDRSLNTPFLNQPPSWMFPPWLKSFS